MSSLEALTGTGTYAKEPGGVSAASSSFVEATVATTPTEVDEEVMVLVGAEGSQLQAGPCRWAPRPGAQPWPRRGDPCLVVTGDKGHRALEWWKPAVPAALGIPRVTALPDDPVDGQEIAYVADAAKGVLWHLQYNAGSASPYKWEALGAPAVESWSTAQLYQPPGASAAVATTAPGGAAPWSTANFLLRTGTSGPALSIPLAGDFELDLKGGFQAPGGLPNNSDDYCSLWIGTSAVSAALGGGGAFTNALKHAFDTLNIGGPVGVQAAIPGGTVLALWAGISLSAYQAYTYGPLGIRAKPVRVG